LPGFMRLPLSYAAGVMGRFTHSRFLTAQIVNDLFAFKYYSTFLAEEELKFKARYAFGESIERAWAFYRQNNLM